jgi:hypothetical protein
MRFSKSVALSVLLACCLPAAAKDKKKILLPEDILRAETVLVVVDPDAGMALDNPNANRNARQAVETALLNWGRFRLANDASTADLIIVVRKGNGRMAQPTIGGLPNNRPVGIDPSDSGGRVDASRGTPSTPGDPTAPRRPNPAPQMEVGPTEDLFSLYRGKRDNPLEAPPVWRFQQKDGLRSPDPPAVDAFRKLVVEAEKQRAANP